MTPSVTTPLPYLSAQAACAGFVVALLYAIGNMAFIVANGAEDLPYAYLWACVLIPPLSLGYNRLQREWSVFRLNIATLALFTAVHLLAWSFAQSTRLDVAAYLLFIGYALALAFLVIVVTTQANRLFTPVEMKTQFPLMLAVQTVALIICGIIIAPLSRWLGGEIHTLFVGAAVMLVMIVVQGLTSRRFPELTQRPRQDVHQPVRIEQLLRARLPRLLLVYQFLSSTGSLLVMYLVPVMAERVWQSSDKLTEFFGYLIAGATFGALLFLVFGAGRVLLNRGTGFGLILNPVGVIVVVVLMLICNLVLPQYTVLLLGLAASARALDFILSIGTTETSVNSFIKQLPENTQLSLITAINAAASPLSYGVAGIMVLILQSWTGSSLTSLLTVTLFVCVAWTMVAFRLMPEAEQVDTTGT